MRAATHIPGTPQKMLILNFILKLVYETENYFPNQLE